MCQPEYEPEKRYCPDCKVDVIPSVGHDDICSPTCFTDLRAYNPDLEWEEENQGMMLF